MERCAVIFADVIRRHANSCDLPRALVLVVYKDVAEADPFAEALGGC